MNIVSASCLSEVDYTSRICKAFIIYKNIKGKRRFFTFCKWREDHLHFYIEGYCDYYKWVPTQWINN